MVELVVLYKTPHDPEQSLATGTAILLCAIVTALFLRVSMADFIRCFMRTIFQLRLAILTVMFIIALAYVMNYSGMTFTLGKEVASLGKISTALRSRPTFWLSMPPLRRHALVNRVEVLRS